MLWNILTATKFAAGIAMFVAFFMAMKNFAHGQFDWWALVSVLSFTVVIAIYIAERKHYPPLDDT